MDLDTENRIAAILMKEAAALRRQAQQEGALAYLRQPTARGRPNSRFLNATIRSIEQANRAVEVNEMWQARQKELELDGRPKSRPRNEGKRRSEDADMALSRSRSERHYSNPASSSSKQSYDGYHCGEDNSLRDDELEQFLQSRAKRGRGSVGPRMDETGPYLPPSSALQDGIGTTSDYINNEKHRRALLGPKKPSSLKRFESSDEESEGKRKKSKKSSTRRSEKSHSKKHKLKDKSSDEKKKKREKRHKH